MMSNRVCKAAIDCTGFLCELQNTILLIVTNNITDPEAIDDFNELKERFEVRYERWKAKYIDFNTD